MQIILTLIIITCYASYLLYYYSLYSMRSVYFNAKVVNVFER